MPSDRRLHPASILFGLARGVRTFAVPGLLVLVGAGSAGWEWQVWMMPLLIPYVLGSVVKYASFRYRYEANEMVIRTGILFRNERHVPYARIQNLNAVQNVFHRLLGVVEVRVETGGGEKPEATMSVLPAAAFEEMRRRVFAQREEGAADGSTAPTAGRTLLYLPPRELLLCGFIENRGFVLIAAAFGLLWELGVMEGLVDRMSGRAVSGRGVVRALLAAVFGGGGVPWSRIGITLAAFTVLLLLVRLVSMAWALLRLHGFRLTREGEDLRAEYGLLTRVAATIPRRRIQTLTISEGPLHQLFGRAAVRVDTAGGGGGGEDEDGKAQREWLAPILRRGEVPGFLAEVLPGLDLAAVEWRAAHPRAFRRELKASVLFAAAVTLPFLLLLKGWALALFAVLAVWAGLAARLYVAHLGWGVSSGAVFFRSGWLWRRLSVAPFNKIQAVAIHESPFDRRAAMARVRVDAAGAGAFSHRVDIPYLARETARDLHDLLAAQAAHTAFRW